MYKDQTLYEIAQKLSSNQEETTELYNHLYQKRYGEEDNSLNESNLSYSFANSNLYKLAQRLSQSEDTLTQVKERLDSYKEMYFSLYGTLEGAFTLGESDSLGEAYSSKGKDILWEDKEGTKKDLPAMEGYLLGVGSNSQYDSPYPKEFELTKKEDMESIFLSSDPDVVLAELSSLPDVENQLKLDSPFYKLTAPQIQTLTDQVKSFDLTEETKISISLPSKLSSKVKENLNQLSSEEINDQNLPYIILSEQLLKEKPIPSSLLEERLKTISVSDKSILGGDLGYRYLLSHLRDNLIFDKKKEKPLEKEVIKEKTASLSDASKQSSESKTVRREDLYQESFLDPEELVNNQQNLSEDAHVISLTDLNVSSDSTVTSKKGDRKIKLPIAVLGEWHHPQYKKVSFTQKDFDEMIKNFNSKATGYEPPLFLGHENPRNKSVGGEPAVGFLESLYQDDNVLFGLFEPVEDKVYNDVDQGKYRYASAEYGKNCISKESGKNLGTVLMGSALTNRPHLTNMPRVEALSDASSTELTFDITKGENMTETNQDKTSNVQDSFSESSTTNYSDNEFKEILNLTKRIEQLENQINLRDQRIEQLETDNNQTRKQQKLEKLEKLTLSENTKGKYRDMVENDRLSDDQFEEIYEMLGEVSESEIQKLTTQHGTTSATDEENEERSSENQSGPYDEIIQRNRELIERKKQAQQEEIYNV